MARILYCDTCEVFRHGLTARLSESHEVEVALTAAEMERLAASGEAHLAIIDVAGAREVAGSGAFSKVPLLLLVDDGAPRHLPEALSRASPASVLHRYAPARAALVAVETTLAGGRYIDSSVRAWEAELLDRVMSARGFSARERDVCRVVVDGCPTSEAARRLGLSVHTVKHHLSSIYSKSGVHGRTELIEHLSSSRWLI